MIEAREFEVGYSFDLSRGEIVGRSFDFVEKLPEELETHNIDSS